MTQRGFEASYGHDAEACDAVLVIGGTRRLIALRRLLRRGVPILQRLDGMNWIHRQRPTGLRHYLRAEWNNLNLRIIRSRFAHTVIYQSEFARRWWERVYGPAPAQTYVIHNGVPLDVYSPSGPGKRPQDRWRILVVEGNLAGGYEIGLEWATELAEGLQRREGRDVELAIAGWVPTGARQEAASVAVRQLGRVPPKEIPKWARSAHLLYSADLHPACPNSVLEAMACGLPVLAFDTGALAELVTADAGALVPYGADPWRVEPPDLAALVKAGQSVLRQQDRLRLGARARAEAAFSLDRMVGDYLAALGWG